MSPNKDEIKAWLSKNDLSYEWLAEKCLVTYGTVRNWMAKKPIPKVKLALIQSLMTEDANSQEFAEEEVITLTFSPSEVQIIRAFKLAFPDIDIEAYCHDKALEFCIGMSSIAAQNSAIPVQDSISDIPTTFEGTGTHVQQPAPQPDAAQNKPSLS